MVVKLQLVAVRVELPTNTPVVLLQEEGGVQRTLPIFVGTPEATAIAYAMQGVVPPRPMSHDLMRELLAATNSVLNAVIITELIDGTYYADLHLGTPAGPETVSARPSDAIALAIRTGAPLYAEDELIDEEGVLLADDDGESSDDSLDTEEQEELVDEFRRFIDEVSPEDFSPPPS